MGQVLATKEPRTEAMALSQPALTPMEMLDRAVQSGATTETLEKLLSLQERYQASEARKAFDSAIADAKAEIKPVTRNSTGHNSKKYADFSALARAVDPILSKHGLSYRFRSEQGDRINVTCILSHRGGHSEQTTLSGPADASGSKNAIQAIGSTLTYLQRYSLVQALGLAVANDDDGEAAGGVIEQAQIERLQALIVEVGADIPKFCKYMKVEKIADIREKDFDRAVQALEAKRK